MGEMAPCLRSAFAVLHLGCANVYVRASSLAPVSFVKNGKPSYECVLTFSRTSESELFIKLGRQELLIKSGRQQRKHISPDAYHSCSNVIHVCDLSDFSKHGFIQWRLDDPTVYKSTGCSLLLRGLNVMWHCCEDILNSLSKISV